VDAWPAGRFSPLVLLLPATEQGKPLVKQLERSRGATYLSARFEGVTPGEYIVAFEPLEPEKDAAR
jgi:hypothetical protein